MHSDYPEIYRWSVDPRSAHLWRYRGGTPSPDVVLRQMWDGSPIQYVIQDRRTGQPLALTGLYNANHVSRYAYLFALSAPERLGTGMALRGAIELLDMAFPQFRLRKVYIECSESSFKQYRSGLRAGVLMEEGRLHQHEWNGSDYEDLISLSISVDAWREYRRRTPRA